MDHSRLANQEQEGPYRSFINTGLERNRCLLGRTSRLWHREGKKVSTLWKRKACHRQAVRITGWRLHDLRRTIVSGMARLGIPPHVADKILNHHSAAALSGVGGLNSDSVRLSDLARALDGECKLESAGRPPDGHHPIRASALGKR